MKKIFKGIATFALVISASTSNATVLTSYYGDNDGFGIGATSGALPGGNPNSFNHATPGEAPGTDIALIGNSFSNTAFAPTGSFAFGGPLTNIVSAVLTLRTGAFSNFSPLDGVNKIVLDGVVIDSALFSQFTENPSSSTQVDIAEHSVSLDSSLFASLSDGLVNLAGTHVSEGSGYGSFVVDFLSLAVTTEVTTKSVPEPSSLALAAIGLFGLGAYRRRKI